jgi:hypothetical protein
MKPRNEKLYKLAKRALAISRKHGGLVRPHVNQIAKEAGVSQTEASQVLTAVRLATE